MSELRGSASPINALPVNGAWDEEHCAHCPWLEWDEEAGRCRNRGEFICWVHLGEVFHRH